MSGQDLGALEVVGAVDEDLPPVDGMFRKPTGPTDIGEAAHHRLGFEPNEETVGCGATSQGEGELDICGLMGAGERGGRLDGDVIPGQEKTPVVARSHLDEITGGDGVRSPEGGNELRREPGSRAPPGKPSAAELPCREPDRGCLCRATRRGPIRRW